MPIEHSKQTIVKETITGTLSPDEIIDILILYYSDLNIKLAPENFTFNIGDDAPFFGIDINKEIELTTQ